MRIALLSTFYPFRGGIAQFNALLYKSLEKQGHEVKAYTFSCQYPPVLFPGKTQYVTETDKAIPIDSEAVLNTVNPLSYEKTAKEILKWKPDVLVMKYWMSFFAPSLSYVAKRLKKKGVKTICIIDNAVPHEPHFFDKPLARLFFRQCTHFIVMSEVVRNDLLRLCPEANERLLPHPLYDHFGEPVEQTAARLQTGLNPDKKTLLFFGLIRDYKGLDILIQAMAFLDDSYQLLVAGESYGDFGKYRQLIETSPARSRIMVWNRYISDGEVPALFSAADILVLPYKSATQSGVIPVAYHFEVPIVATGVGNLKDTIETAGTGIVCRPQAESIAEGIRKIFSEGKEKFIANIRTEKKNLSWYGFAQALIDFSQ
ncbi:MAG: glycosyltransferase [Dysgonamonadaceae bacterium]|jgi:glycosyltransferase involved in cell wall biosynthesis|nr:glycosyltransferase [Dysgonamonadaceae bacterium]